MFIIEYKHPALYRIQFLLLLCLVLYFPKYNHKYNGLASQTFNSDFFKHPIKTIQAIYCYTPILFIHTILNELQKVFGKKHFFFFCSSSSLITLYHLNALCKIYNIHTDTHRHTQMCSVNKEE